MTELKFIRSLSTKTPNIKDGQILYTTDDNRLYIDVGSLRKQVNAITTDNITYGLEQLVLTSLIKDYIMEIDYNNLLAFDVNEIVFGTSIDDEPEDKPDDPEIPDTPVDPDEPEISIETAILGTAILGTMILGKN